MDHDFVEVVVGESSVSLWPTNNSSVTGVFVPAEVLASVASSERPDVFVGKIDK